MGAGDFAAGLGPFGHDPVGDPSTRTLVAPVAAAFFDPSTRDYPLDANGRVVAIHPVDQAVALALTIELGAVGSVSDLGHELRRIPRGTQPQIASYAADAVKRALKAITDRGDATLLNVTTVSPFRGAQQVTVEYRNNRLSPPAIRTQTAAFR